MTAFKKTLSSASGAGEERKTTVAHICRGIIAASFLMLAGGAARAESVLTMHIEEQTSWVQNFNPFDLGGRRQSTMDFVYEPLVIFNDYDSGKPIYRLATGYKFSDDLKSITYTLRDGVKWSDGQPLTSADMKFTLELMLKNPAVDIVGVGESVASVEAPSPTEVKITLKDVDTHFPESLADFPVVPEHIWKDVADPLAFKNEKPVGSGPMTEIRRFTPQVYEQCRNPNYWDAASLKVDCLKLPQIAGNDQMLALLPDGTMDWIGSFLPEIDKTYVGARSRSQRLLAAAGRDRRLPDEPEERQRRQCRSLQRHQFPPRLQPGDGPHLDGRHRRLRLSGRQPACQRPAAALRRLAQQGRRRRRRTNG